MQQFVGGADLSKIFISHSSRDNFEAQAIANWLAEGGWNELFLDLDPDRGITAGERWSGVCMRRRSVVRR
jgi:hypothetical protein